MMDSSDEEQMLVADILRNYKRSAAVAAAVSISQLSPSAIRALFDESKSMSGGARGCWSVVTVWGHPVLF